MIDVSIEMSPKLEANLKILRQFAKKAPHKELIKVANELLRLSQKEVPHDKGTLQDSGTVEETSDNVIVGYHTPYAHRLHEHPEYRFQKGRKGKYLTDPLEKNIITFTEQLKSGLDDDLRSAIK